MKRPDPVAAVKERRDTALTTIAGQIPYIRFLGVHFDRHGDQLTAVLTYSEDLIGNPLLPAIHGGATAAFLEIAAIVGLTWAHKWEEIEAGTLAAPFALPKTVDFTVDYLRSGLPRDAYAVAKITRSGRRYASVQVDAWQDNRDRLFAQAIGHFVMPQNDDS